MKDMHEKYCCEVALGRTKDLKKLVTESFPEESRFTSSICLHGSPLILDTSDVNPLWGVS